MNKFCSKCGSVLDSKTGVCPTCSDAKTGVYRGDVSDWFNNMPTNKVNSDDKKKKIITIVAIVVAVSMLLGIFGVGGYLIGRGKNSLPNAYSQVVEMYKQILIDENADGNQLSGALVNKIRESDDYEISYSYIDINDDETKELIVGGSEKGSESVEIYDVFTMDEEENAVQLFNVANFNDDTEIEIYNAVIKVSEEKEETSHFEYLKLPENQWEVEKDEEYLYEDSTYYEIVDDNKVEISEETFNEADNKYEGEELDLEWVKVVLEEDKKEKETKQDNSNPEWVAELTKGYWDNSGQSVFLYKFNADGTGKSYCVEDMNPIDTNKLDTIEPYNISSFTWKADGDYLHVVFEEYTQNAKWVSYSDNYNWQGGILYPKDENFFYDVEYVEDEYGMSNVFYLIRHHEEKTETTTETTTEKPKKSDAEVYQEYLKNGGLDKFMENMNIEGSRNSVEIKSCLIDMNNDGTSELLFTLTDVEGPAVKGHEEYGVVLAIQNNKVVQLTSAYNGGGSMGGEHLYIKYDANKNKHTVFYNETIYDGTFSSTSSNKAYSYDGNKISSYINFSNYYYNQSTNYYDDIIREHNSKTTTYVIKDENKYYYYVIGNEYVTQNNYQFTYARFKDPTDSKYKMKTGTWNNPLAL